MMIGSRLNTLWRLLEMYHAVVYFATERRECYEALGLKGGWMGYFATRAGAFGNVPPAVVTACFYNFHHSMVARALPDAWRYTTPEQACSARLAVFDRAICRLVDGDLTGPEVREAAQLAGAAVSGCEDNGRALFAAHASLPVPDEPHLALFWAATALREFRGDGHNIALAANDVDGCEANVLMATLGLVPSDQRRYRGWSDQDWCQATSRLIECGWLNRDGSITREGWHARAEIERATDLLAEAPWRYLGEAATGRLTELLSPLVARIVTEGGIPFPNPMGVPSTPELRAGR